MNIKDLLREDDAVSPVIGVILMVAITVILAAVIGTFVLGLGDQVQSSAPNANFQFEYTMDGGDAQDNDDRMTITHNGGQDVDLSTVSVIVGGTTVYESSSVVAEVSGDSQNDLDAGSGPTNWADPISTGSAQVINEVDVDTSPNSADVISPGDDVRVVWTSPNGDSSNTIGSSTVPN